jgi:polysaccharide biosynthesis/export protein
MKRTMLKILWLMLMAVVVSSCNLAPGMKFNEKSKGVEGLHKVVRSGQYILRVIPITTKLVYLQNKTVKSSFIQATQNVARSSSAIEKPHIYRVQASDVLDIRSWEDLYGSAVVFGDQDIEGEGRNPNYNRAGTGSGTTVKVVVDSEGKIYFPFAGEVYVAGKTSAEIRRILQNKLKRYFEDPKISVRVEGYNSQYVMVTGKVSRPGKVPITNKPLRVFDAIYAAGGLQSDGFWKNATLTRRDGQIISLNLHALLDKGNLLQNYTLRDGDIIHVPTVEGSTAYILGGGVGGSARPMLLQNNTVSLAEAIGNAGGLSETVSNPKAVYVLRREEGRPLAEITAYHLDARSPASLVLANSFYLKPKDIVYADTSGMVRWNRVVSLITSVFTNPIASVGAVQRGVDTVADN